ncbi:pyridoxal phosphate-dependent aminotransferase [Piscirickettsia litoralis]|nr:pyridoxal phosphate-dependent aminotransferase [Piscirickettsia litoralis]
MKPLNKDIQILAQSPIRSATTRCNELNGINLGQGVCDLPVQKAIKDAASAAIYNNQNLYSDNRGVSELRQALRHKIANFNLIDVNPDNELLITHGATGGYVSALKTLCDPGDEIILFEPFYGYHRNIAETLGITVKTVSINLNDYAFSIDELKQQISPKTKAIIICTPNNPTGKVFTKDELNTIGQLAIEQDLYVITDEMYEYFTYPGFKHVSFASLDERYWQRTITLSGFSKVFNITGWRLGYAYGPEELIVRMSQIQDLFYVCPVTPLQHAVAEALKLPESYYHELQDTFLHKRDLMVTTLRNIGFDVPNPQGAYYLLVDAKNGPLGQIDNLASTLLEESKVATVPGSAFYLDQNKGHSQLRFCFAQGEDKINQAIKKTLCLFQKSHPLTYLAIKMAHSWAITNNNAA